MYKELKKIYDKSNNNGVFAMAVSYLLDKGYDMVLNMNEKDISIIEGNGMMSAEYCQMLVQTAKDIVNACDNNNPVEIIQFCAAEDVFDIQFYANKLPYYRMKEIMDNAICYIKERKPDKEDITDILMCDEEEYALLTGEEE
ncbi:MAG: hypothetical protein J5929_01900 [Eubacterium sp.]|nr:hypothetical protein [Eubacterium sp.]